MFNCINCGAGLPDGANVCPYCKAVQANSNNVYSHIPNTPHDKVISGDRNPAQPQQIYSFNPHSLDENQQFYFQQHLSESINDSSTAKGLGIVSIICAIIPVFIIVCWICGALGIAKANAAIRFSQQAGNPQIFSEAVSAKSLCKTGLIISAVVAGVALMGILVVSIFAGIYGMNL